MELVVSAARGEEIESGERAHPLRVPLADDEAMVLNFERADIREVIHRLATALGLSYTIDPHIEGQVTIRTTGKIARKDLFPLFNEILRNNGIAAVKQGDLYNILPVAEAKTRAIVPTSALRRGYKAEDAFVIFIVWFATEHPFIAAAIVLTMLAAIVLTIRAIVRVLRTWRRGKERTVETVA